MTSLTTLCVLMMLMTTIASSLQQAQALQIPSQYLICVKDTVPDQCLRTLTPSGGEALIVCNHTDASQYSAWSLNQTTGVFTTTVGPQPSLCALHTSDVQALMVSCQITSKPQSDIQILFLDTAQTVFTLKVDVAVSSSGGQITVAFPVVKHDVVNPPVLTAVSSIMTSVIPTQFALVPYTAATGNSNSTNAASGRAIATNALLLVGFVWLMSRLV